MWPDAFAAGPAKAAAADACNEPLVDTLLNGGQADHIRPSIARFLKVLLTWSALWFGPILLILLCLGPQSIYFQQAAFFSKMAVVTFGSIRDVHFLGAHLLVPVWDTINVPTLLIALFAVLALFRLKLGMMTTIGCSAALGLLHHIALG